MTTRNAARRVGAAAILIVQLLLIIRGYSADHAVFGFQMFPESSEWQATIERELVDGALVDVRQDWPGGYRWILVLGPAFLVEPGHRLGDVFRVGPLGRDIARVIFGAADDFLGIDTELDGRLEFLPRRLSRIRMWSPGRIGREETIERLDALNVAVRR